ncbi:hypothetical protein P186_2386 [Pyrobaculum ferrireducens]|uniref:Uncharacterized protein n=1 Tax=Pyrobaculum ferrireducens TaxID=1104324 RepID=G7VC86_9CREN|nr:hypothetical protein P186_2386 [Pyrobaculum ferrireducens]
MTLYTLAPRIYQPALHISRVSFSKFGVVYKTTVEQLRIIRRVGSICLTFSYMFSSVLKGAPASTMQRAVGLVEGARFGELCGYLGGLRPPPSPTMETSG